MATTTASPPVFNIAGHEVKLESNDLPDFVEIKHEVPLAFKEYEQLRALGKNFDTVILIGDKRIPCHKALLSGRIPYFRGLYGSNMTECATGEVPLTGHASSLSALIDYVYTGELKITEENVEELMIAANYLGIESVMDECAQFDRKRLRVETALPVLFQCRAIGYTKIDDVVLRFIDKNFVPISHTPEFLKLDSVQVEGLLHRETLHVDEERQVFDAATRWISESDVRLQHAVKLLRSVRCSLIPHSILTEVIEKTKWVEGNEECLALVQDAKDSYHGKDVVSFSKEERRCDEAHALIFPVGLIPSTQSAKESTMEFYDPIMDRWTKSQNLPSIRGRNAVAVVGRKIFAIGGNDGKDRLKTVDVYDAATDKWEKSADLSAAKAAMGTGVIDGKIYVAGGFNDQAINTVEMLNPADSEPVWTLMTPLTHLRGAPASCVFNGKLYVIGGHDGQQIWKHGECYDPATNTWSMIAEMKHKRCRFGAAVLKGQIYVVGGFDGAAFLRDAERYDPSTNTWTSIKAMEERRSRASLVVSCGKLFAIGGFDGLTNLPSVEMYQPETNTWVKRSKMSDHAGGIAVATLLVPAVFPSPVANLEADDVKGNKKEIAEHRGNGENVEPSTPKKAKNA